MSDVFPWLATAAVFLLLFTLLLLFGIIRKKVSLVIVAAACFLLFMIAGGITAYKTLQGTVRLAADAAARRDGLHTYTDVLGSPHHGCVKFYASSDPLMSTNDEPVSVCFSTCPAEVRRVLQAKSFEIVRRPTADVALDAEQCCDNYFSYERFGDSLLECFSTDESGDICTVWFSTDSTHGFLQTH